MKSFECSEIEYFKCCKIKYLFSVLGKNSLDIYNRYIFSFLLASCEKFFLCIVLIPIESSLLPSKYNFEI